MTAKDSCLARARGAFLGVAVGDALGATTEFMTPAEIRARFGVHRKIVGGGWLYLKPGQVTDDTQMSLHLARAVVERGGWDRTAVAEAFAAWLRGRPVDVGATCARGIRRYLHTGALEVPPNRWDAGNGAAMRMAPVALLTLGDDRLLTRCALEQAHLTHNHPYSDAACVALGRLVHRAALGAGAGGLRAVAGGLAADHPVFTFRERGGYSSPFVVDTLNCALHHFFTTSSFEQCLIGVVNEGGDADTAGAVAGMIAGAHYGPDAIPRRWLRKLDRRLVEEISDLSARLVRLSPLGASFDWDQSVLGGEVRVA